MSPTVRYTAAVEHMCFILQVSFKLYSPQNYSLKKYVAKKFQTFLMHLTFLMIRKYNFELSNPTCFNCNP